MIGTSFIQKFLYSKKFPKRPKSEKEGDRTKKKTKAKEYIRIYLQIKIDKRIKKIYNTEKRDIVKFITYGQYIEHLKNTTMQIKEKGMDYSIFNTKDELKEVDKQHDKMFRSILGRKNEMTKFLNQFLELKEKIEEKQIIQCNTDFITKQYKERHSDIIYKIKNKPIYFLVEHQSTIDQEMSLRIWEYVGEIIRTESITQETYLRRDKIYPVIVPIVIYTGFQKWNAKTNFAQKQYESENYEKYKIYLEYNLIAVQDYTFEELLEKGTLFASIMIMEKCRTKQELISRMDKVIEIIKDTRDKETLSEIINYVVAPRIGRKKANIMLKKIKEKEESGMSPLTKMLFEWEREIKEEREKAQKTGRAKGIAEGRKEARKEGRKEGILETAKKMIQRNMELNEIEEITGISKKEIENIKVMLAKT